MEYSHDIPASVMMSDYRESERGAKKKQKIRCHTHSADCGMMNASTVSDWIYVRNA